MGIRKLDMSGFQIFNLSSVFERSSFRMVFTSLDGFIYKYFIYIKRSRLVHTIRKPDLKNVWFSNESSFWMVGFRIPTVMYILVTFQMVQILTFFLVFVKEMWSSFVSGYIVVTSACFVWPYLIFVTCIFFRALQRSGLHGTGATGDEAEALSSLSAAILLHTKGNADKARKLFRHALALCPKHPKILNHYGEFLETSEGRILQVTRLAWASIKIVVGKQKDWCIQIAQDNHNR